MHAQLRTTVISFWRFPGSSRRSSTASECLQAAITPTVATNIQRQGFAVVDKVFGDGLSKILLEEIKSIHTQGLMHLNHTHFVKAGERSLLQKAGIYEGDLLQQDTFAAAGHFAQLQTDTGFRTMLSLLLPQLRLDAQSTKLQFNAGGGGSFPMHLDSDESVDSRRVSAIVYLNPMWKEGDGGELRLYPSWDNFLDIQPVNDRLVLFPSCRMPHRVMPSRAERYCFTIWLSQTRGAGKPPRSISHILHDLSKKGDVRRALMEPELRKALTKVAFADEWATSLTESHPESQARTSTVNTFNAELSLLRTEIGRVLPGYDTLIGSKAVGSPWI